MSQGWKVTLWILGGLSLLIIIGIGGLVFWVYQNKDQWIETVRKVEKDADEYGRNTDNAGCLKEALSRQKRDKSFSGSIATNVFLQTCLRSSAPTPGFCEGVPSEKEFVKYITWVSNQCSKAGLSNNNNCQRLFQAVQKHCERRNE